jgi:hypothetical protein
VEIPRESVRLMAESTGLELSDEVAALLAEDVCYRLREATQVCSPQFLVPHSLWFSLLLISFHIDLLSKYTLGTYLCLSAWRKSVPFTELPSSK